MEFECDTTDFKKLEEELIQNIDCEGIYYKGKRWIKEDYCVLKSVIREKLKIARKHKQKADNTIKLYTLKQAYGFREDVFEELLGEEK